MNPYRESPRVVYDPGRPLWRVLLDPVPVFAAMGVLMMIMHTVAWWLWTPKGTFAIFLVGIGAMATLFIPIWRITMRWWCEDALPAMAPRPRIVRADEDERQGAMR